MKRPTIAALTCLIAFAAVLPLGAQQMTGDADHSPYLLAVDEYVPAPGQFVNDLPVWEPGDDAARMAAKCTEAIAGDYAGLDHGMITLGGTLRFEALRRNRNVLVPVLGIRLLVLPVVMVSIAYLIGLRGVELFLVLMVYGTPVAASSYPMALNMGGDGELAGQLVFVSTVLSMCTVFGFIFLMSRLGLLGI